MTTTTRYVLATLGVAAVLAAAGCGDGAADGSGGTPPAGTATASGAPVAPSAAGGAGDPSGSSSGASRSATGGAGTADDAHLSRFQSPSGNIACDLRFGGARCDIVEHDYRAAGRPSDCQGSWGSAVHVGRTGRGGFLCVGDTVADPGDPKLGYGERTVAEGYTCTSRRSGVTCRSAGGHGFTLSRQAYTFF